MLGNTTHCRILPSFSFSSPAGAEVTVHSVISRNPSLSVCIKQGDANYSRCTVRLVFLRSDLDSLPSVHSPVMSPLKINPSENSPGKYFHHHSAGQFHPGHSSSRRFPLWKTPFPENVSRTFRRTLPRTIPWNASWVSQFMGCLLWSPGSIMKHLK